MKQIIVLICVLVVFTSCGGAGFSSGGKNSKEYDNAITRSVDSGIYRDLTAQSADANLITKEDLLYLSEGSFYNGNSKITLNATKGTIELYNPQAVINGKTGLYEFETKYQFTVFPADKHTIYIRQSNRKLLSVKLNGIEISGNDIPDLITCVPFYGFGGNRLEVSSVMDGYIAMPSGTYWKK